MGWRGKTVGLVALGLLVSARGVAAETTLSAGLAAYERLEYQRAVELLQLARPIATTIDDKVTIARTLAFAHVALGQIDKARTEFRVLLDLDPLTTLDRTVSPRMRSVFDEVVAQFARDHDAKEEEPAPPPESVVVAIAPARPRAGQPVALTLSAPRGATARLLYRTRGDVQYARLTAHGQDGHFDLSVPAGGVKAPALEYFLVALDDKGVPVGLAGDIDRPLAVGVDATARKPIYRRAWFWATLGGLVAAGAITGAVVGTTPAHVTIQHP